MARGKKHSAEQIVNVLRQIEVAIANGKTTPAACKEAGIMGTDLLSLAQGIRRPEGGPGKAAKELEQENGKFKRLVAELSLDKQILQDIARGDF